VLEFSAEELGAFTVRCEREFTPLRWTIRYSGEGYVLRLLDDTGSAAKQEVVRMDFETPAVEEPLDLAFQCQAPAAGGLYVARVGEFTAAMIVSPTDRRRTLADLRCDPRIQRHKRSVEAVR
jgi:hypothetical protein